MSTIFKEDKPNENAGLRGKQVYNLEALLHLRKEADEMLLALREQMDQLDGVQASASLASLELDWRENTLRSLQSRLTGAMRGASVELRLEVPAPLGVDMGGAPLGPSIKEQLLYMDEVTDAAMGAVAKQALAQGLSTEQARALVDDLKRAQRLQEEAKKAIPKKRR